jgi:hypothetical protein
VTLKAFFIDALTSALDLGLGTPDDVLRHATPDVLATHLPRPLWARLLTACLGASRVDAQLVIETIGIPNLCEHVPQSILWLAIRDIATRALGKSVLAPPPDERPARPPSSSPAPVAVGPAIPSPAASTDSLAEVIHELEADPPPPSERTSALRPRSATSQRFRPSNTAATRLGAARRPQAIATPVPTPAPPPPAPAPSAFSGRPRRDPTQSEEEIETRVGDGNSEWGGNDRGSGRAISVDDSQLVDWQANTDGSGTTALSDEDFSDLGPKR